MPLARSFKTALMRGYILVALLPLLLMSGTLLYFLTDRLREDVSHKNQVFAQFLAAETNAFLEEPQNILTRIRMTLEEFPAREGQSISGYIRTILSTYPYFESIQLASESGKIQQVFPYSPNDMGNDLSGQSFFQEALKTRERVWSSVFVSHKTGNPTLAMVEPGKSTLVIGFLNLKKLNSIIKQFYSENKIAAGIVDRQGNLIAYSLSSLTDQRANVKNLEVVAQGLQGKDSTAFQIFQTKEILSSSAVISSTGWLAVIFHSSEQAFKIILLARYLFLGGLLAAFALSFLLAFLNLKKSLPAFTRLQKQTQELALGHYPEQKTWSGYEELDRLLKDFYQMAEQIRLREKDLKETNQMFSTLIHSAPLSMIILDEHGTIHLWNPAAEELFGWSAQEAIGKTYLTIPENKEEEARDLRQKIFNGESLFGYETIRKKKNGELVDTLIAAAPLLTDTEGVKSIVTLILDISRQKQAERKLLDSLKEKEVLLKEVYHRVKNNLQIVVSLLSLQEFYLEDSSAKKALKGIQNRIYSMSVIHEKLYQSKNLTKIDLEDYTQTLAEHLILSYSEQPDQIQLILDIQDSLLSLEKAVPCGLILNELISNSLKYAFPKGRKGTIQVISRKKENHLQLTYLDNGVGFPENFDPDKASSLGMQLVSTLVQQLGGTLSLRSEQGVLVLIHFPLEFSKPSS